MRLRVAVLLAATTMLATPALADSSHIGGDQSQSQGQGQIQGQGQSQGQTAYGGNGTGVGIAGAYSGSRSRSNATAVGVNENENANSLKSSNKASSTSAGQSSDQSVQGDSNKYDSFAFGYAAPGLTVENNGVVGDETVTLPGGFQVPGIGGGYFWTDEKPTIGFQWRVMPQTVRAFYEDYSDTPEMRAQSEFVRAFACTYFDYTHNLPETTPYKGCN